jgi:hypothetical protein
MGSIPEYTDFGVRSDWLRIEVDSDETVEDERRQTRHWVDLAEQTHALGHAGRAFLLEGGENPYSIAKWRPIACVSQKVFGVLKPVT